jgi:hypothetical protein
MSYLFLSPLCFIMGLRPMRLRFTPRPANCIKKDTLPDVLLERLYKDE